MRSKLTPSFEKSVYDYIREVNAKNKKTGADTAPPTITISREFGCAGFPLAKELIARLSDKKTNWKLYSRDLIKAIGDEDEKSDLMLESIDEEKRNIIFQDLQELLQVKPSDFSRFNKLAQNVRIIGEAGNAVIVGSGASLLAHKDQNFFNVRITGSYEFRVQRIMKELDLNLYNAKKMVTEQGNERAAFIHKFTRKDVASPAHYQMVLRNDFFTVEDMADLIISGMKKLEML